MLPVCLLTASAFLSFSTGAATALLSADSACVSVLDVRVPGEDEGGWVVLVVEALELEVLEVDAEVDFDADADDLPCVEEDPEVEACRFSGPLALSPPGEVDERLLLVLEDEEEREEEGEEEEGCPAERLTVTSWGALERSWGWCLTDVPPVEVRTVTPLYSIQTH